MSKPACLRSSFCFFCMAFYASSAAFATQPVKPTSISGAAIHNSFVIFQPPICFAADMA